MLGTALSCLIKEFLYISIRDCETTHLLILPVFELLSCSLEQRRDNNPCLPGWRCDTPDKVFSPMAAPYLKMGGGGSGYGPLLTYFQRALI